MYKKIITVILCSGSALSMMAANATDAFDDGSVVSDTTPAPRVYVMGQLGDATTHMHNKVGYIWNTGEKPTPLNLSNDGLAARFAVGYPINPHLALEAGYLNIMGGKDYVGKMLDSGNRLYKYHLAQYALDLNLKGTLPITEQLQFYTKAGIAYLNSSLSARPVTESATQMDLLVTTPKRAWAPEVALGVSYDLTPNLPIDLSWTHIQQVGTKNKAALGNINFIAVGIGYRFGGPAVDSSEIEDINAGIPSGVYVSGQLGYADTHMRNKVGYIWNQGDTPTRLNDISNNGLAGRFTVGYQFNPKFALEAGYLNILGNKNYTGLMPGESKTDLYKYHLAQHAFDVNAKAIFPINDQFNLYAKAGAAYLTSTVDAQSVSEASRHMDLLVTTPRRTWAPEAAVGISYNLTPNLPIDVSLTHIQPLGNAKDKLGNIDFAALGIGYHFA